MAKKKVVETNEGGLPLVKPNKTFFRDVPVTFTDKELIDYGKHLVELRGEVEQLKVEKKEATKEYKDKIEAKETEMKKIDGYIENGSGQVSVEVEVFLNMPNGGKKQICRKDNGELVEELDMTMDELQVKFEFQGLNAAKDEDAF